METARGTHVPPREIARRVASRRGTGTDISFPPASSSSSSSSSCFATGRGSWILNSPTRHSRATAYDLAAAYVSRPSQLRSFNARASQEKLMVHDVASFSKTTWSRKGSSRHAPTLSPLPSNKIVTHHFKCLAVSRRVEPMPRNAVLNARDRVPYTPGTARQLSRPRELQGSRVCEGSLALSITDRSGRPLRCNSPYRRTNPKSLSLSRSLTAIRTAIFRYDIPHYRGARFLMP